MDDKHLCISFGDKNQEISYTLYTEGNHIDRKTIQSITDIVYTAKDNISAILAGNKSQKEVVNKQIYTVELPAVRERIPNEIDLSKLSIQQAETEESLVRCPHCGQSSLIIVTVNGRSYLFRNVKDHLEAHPLNEDPNILNSVRNIVYKPSDKQSISEYYNYIDLFTFDPDIDIVVDNTQTCLCPICNSSSDFSKWKDAYKNPLKYFETEHLCEWCGGETTLVESEGDKLIFECEKCGHRQEE